MDNVKEKVKDSFDIIFRNATNRMYKFTKLDDSLIKDAFNTPIVKLVASFVVIIIMSLAVYIVGNIILLLVHLSLAQYLVTIIIVTIAAFIVMMVIEEGAYNIESAVSDAIIHDDRSGKPDVNEKL